MKVYHACVGSAGAVRFALYFAVIGSTTLHPLELNVTIRLCVSSQCAYNVISDVIGVEKLKAVVAPVKYHPRNLCCDQVGLVGASTVCHEATSMYGTDTVHPFPSKVTLLATSHCA